MTDLFPVLLHDGLERVDSRLIASQFDIENRSVVKLTDKHKKSIEKDFGLLAFEMLKVPKGRPIKVYYYTEDQALFVGSLSRNTAKVVAFKSKLVRSFLHYRKKTHQIQVPTKLSEALRLAADQAEEIERLTPLAQHTEKILTAANSFPIRVIADDFDMSSTALNKMLDAAGVQYKTKEGWILTAKYRGKGYTESYVKEYTDNKGVVRTRRQMNWTEVGRYFVHSLFPHLLNPAK